MMQNDAFPNYLFVDKSSSIMGNSFSCLFALLLKRGTDRSYEVSTCFQQDPNNLPLALQGIAIPQKNEM